MKRLPIKTTKFWVWLLGGLAGLCLVAAVVGVAYLYGSTQPSVGRGGKIPSLMAAVDIHQDAQGVPTIAGQNVEDIFRAQGWIVARDRLFQMDLFRRRSAGALSEIFGQEALAYDRLHRIFNFKQVALEAAAQMSPKKKRYFEAYAQGVNAYIQMGPLPFEMRLLGYEPKAWTVADCLMVVLAMFEDLDYNPNVFAELAVTELHRKQPASVLKFLTPLRGFLDTPVVPDESQKVKLPSPSELDLRGTSIRIPWVPKNLYDPPRNGSNGWAISGKWTKSGKPILAGDPHLDLFAPNIWYRNHLKGKGLDVVGVSLPGVPGVIIGSNEKVAWTFTAPSTDTLDLIPFKETMEFVSRKENISIKGKEDEVFPIKETQWGPVLRTPQGSEFVLQWTALDAQALAESDITLLNFAKDSNSLLEAAKAWAGPSQNLVYATRDGDIGWVLVGKVPKRVGFSGLVATHRDAKQKWLGYRRFSELPKIRNPKSGFVVSANQRMVPFRSGWVEPALVGANWSNPSRAFRILERLRQESQWDAEKTLGVQLDIYSHNIVFYREALLRAIDKHQGQNPWIAQIKKLIEPWDGRVSLDSAAYPFLKNFRWQCFAFFVDPLWGVPWWKGQSVFSSWPAAQWYYHEPVLRALWENKPRHLLAKQFSSYEAAMIEAAQRSAQLFAKKPEDLFKLRWGSENRSPIHHPFSQGLPRFLGQFFLIGDDEHLGDRFVPRASSSLYGRFHGPSMRMVVDLGNKKASIFNHAGGQSGHFQSPNYRDQYPAWLKGEGTPFYPGKTLTTDSLSP